MAVSRLVTLFESLDSRATTKPRRSRTQATPRYIQPPRHFEPSLPFSDFNLSLEINDFRSTSPMTMTSTPSSSMASSPSSSLRNSKRYSRSYSLYSTPSSRCLLRRQPSAVDIELQEERNTAGAMGLGLTLMEPRPVLDVPLSIGMSHIFDGTDHEEEKQPFFMSGIIEVMEGAS